MIDLSGRPGGVTWGVLQSFQQVRTGAVHQRPWTTDLLKSRQKWKKRCGFHT